MRHRTWSESPWELDYLRAHVVITGPLGWPQMREPTSREGSRYKGGCVEFRMMGVSASAARVVWFLTTGVWPVGRMGVRGQDQCDIRFANLFLVGKPDSFDLV